MKIKKQRIYLTRWVNGEKEVRVDELDSIVNQLPKEFNAKVDHRITRDTWIFVDEDKRNETLQYLDNVLKVRYVLTRISDNW